MRFKALGLGFQDLGLAHRASNMKPDNVPQL